MCHFLLQFGAQGLCVGLTEAESVCVRVCAFWPCRDWVTVFGRGANWRGALHHRRVLSEHEGRWINKSWGSKFCHMSGHVFPSTSWERSAPRLARPADSSMTGTVSLLRATGVLQWALWRGKCRVVYLWATCSAQRSHIVQTLLELMV